MFVPTFCGSTHVVSLTRHGVLGGVVEHSGSTHVVSLTRHETMVVQSFPVYRCCVANATCDNGCAIHFAVGGWNVGGIAFG